MDQTSRQRSHSLFPGTWRTVLIFAPLMIILGAGLWWALRPADFIPLNGHQHGVNKVLFSPDGQLVASASDDQTIRLWNHNGQPVTVITGHTDRVTALAFSSSGKELAGATGTGEVRIWDVATGIEIRMFQAHADCIQGLVWGSGDSLLYAIGWDSTLSVWNPGNGQLIRRTTCPAVAECCILASGTADLLVGCVDGVIRRWSISRDQVDDVFTQHRDQVKGLRFSDDETCVLSCGRDHLLTVWNYSTGEVTFQVRAHSPLRDAICFDNQEKIIAVTESGELLLYDRQTQSLLSRTQAPASELLSIAACSEDLFVCGGYSDQAKALLFSTRVLQPSY